jgi:DNA helicase-2/ATP-dependent DNA helicase PcrA
LVKNSIECSWGVSGATALSLLPLAKARFLEKKDFVGIWDAYERTLRELDAFDFDDLVSTAVAAMRADPSLLQSLRNRWPHVLVDEFQDTNLPQYALVKLLCWPSKQGSSLMVVGDIDQSIYGWRGAMVSLLQSSFEKDFAQAETKYLSTNYRHEYIEYLYLFISSAFINKAYIFY